MAGEIEYYLGFTNRNTAKTTVVHSGVRRTSSASVKSSSGTIDVEFTQQAIPLAEVASIGYCYFDNDVSSVGTVEILAGSGGTPFCRLSPGECALLPLAAIPYVKTTDESHAAVLSYVVSSR